jgi:hypothetical protein
VFGAGPLGVLVKLQESGDLKVVGARGAAEARGVLVDDVVAAVDGVPVETGTTEAAFAATIQKAPRPVTITFVRKSGVNIPVVDDDGWRDEAQTYPVPKFGLESEEVDALLRQWSADEQKRKYVRLWLDVVATSPTIPHKFPAGLTLASLEPAVKAGFAQLIVPLLRARGDVVLEVKSRPSPDRPGRVDLELRLARAPRPVRSAAAPPSPKPALPDAWSRFSALTKAKTDQIKATTTGLVAKTGELVSNGIAKVKRRSKTPPRSPPAPPTPEESERRRSMFEAQLAGLRSQV